MKKLFSILLVIMLLGTQLVFAEEKIEQKEEGNGTPARTYTFEELTSLSREDIDHIVIRSGVVGVGYATVSIPSIKNSYSTTYDKIISSIYNTINTKSFKVYASENDGSTHKITYEISFVNKHNETFSYIIGSGIKSKSGVNYKSSNEEELKKVVEKAYNLIANDCSDWSADYIVQAKDLGFLEDVTGISYKEPITREKFCEIIYNMIVKTVDKDWSEPTAIPFVDTHNSKVATLYYKDIIKGKGDKVFAPNDYLTREEAATIIDRIYKNGVPLGTGTTGVWLKFDDESEISDWALYGVQNACKQGIMIGTGSGKFAPKDIYTTEQAITSIVRMYHQNFKGINQRNADKELLLLSEDNMKLKLNADISTINKEPISENEGQGDGFHWKEYSYGDIFVKALIGDNNSTNIIYVSTTSNKYKTPRDIKVGDTLQKLKEKYPEGLNKTLSDQICYEYAPQDIGFNRMYFYINNDTITKIVLENGIDG